MALEVIYILVQPFHLFIRNSLDKWVILPKVKVSSWWHFRFQVFGFLSEYIIVSTPLKKMKIVQKLSDRSFLSAMGPQSWYPVAPLLTSPAEGQGQGRHHYTLSLCPGKETLAHHCEEACCPAHVAPDEQNQGTSALVWTACPAHRLKPTHQLEKWMHFVFRLFDGLHFRDCLIPLVPLEKYRIDYNFDID